VVRAQGLHHDSAEAYTGDIPKPLKDLIWPLFEPIEVGLETAVFAALGLPYPLHPAVKDADNAIYTGEHIFVGPGGRETWSAEEARFRFRFLHEKVMREIEEQGTDVY
jgi:hypothetical protein